VVRHVSNSLRQKHSQGRTWVLSGGEVTPSQVRTLRKRLGPSAEDFSAVLGFSSAHARVTVRRWETCRRKPSAQTVALMRQLSERLK
jgi:DNA-binding transcriptional regulator YiaG